MPGGVADHVQLRTPSGKTRSSQASSSPRTARIIPADDRASMLPGRHIPREPWRPCVIAHVARSNAFTPYGASDCHRVLMQSLGFVTFPTRKAGTVAAFPNTG